MSTKKTATKKTTSKKAQTSKSKTPAAKPRQKPAAKRTAPAKATVRHGNTDAPAAGTVLHRVYKGRKCEVRVLTDSYEFDGQTFKSLTALAKHITGYAAISGPVWFGLAGPKATTKPEA